MKKKYIFGILFSIFTLIFVSACNSPSNIKANFKQAQYTLSIGESINLSDEFNVNGVDKSKVSFESSNPDVALLSDGILKAQDSGSVYVLAKLGQDVLAQAKVQVKYKFSSPQNISVSQIGTLSWDKSYISNKEDGRVINAEKYNLSYALVTDGELEYISTTVSTNSFQLPNTKGVYKIKLQAISQTDEFDNSELVELSVNYGVMGALENVALTNETTGANATISWKEKTNAKYDVYVEGFMVYENFNQNRFTYDFDQYSNLSEIKVEVVAKSTSDDSSLDTSTDIIVTRLKAPELSCTGGQLSLSAIPNAKGYLLKNFNDASDILKLDSPDSIIMEGYESGIYTFSAMAEGSNGDGLFLNSNFSSTLTFAKLEKPTYSFEMTEKGVKIIFEKSSVGVLYNISYADKSQQVASSESGNVEIEVDMSSLSADEYTFALQALPTSGTTFTNGTISTSNVVKSDILTFKVYKTEAIGSISHTFSGKQSIISFDQLEHANKYQLFINDEAPVLEFTEKDGKILFTIDDLSAYSSVEGDYTFKVLAYLEKDDVVVSTTSTQTKIISILDSPQGAENQTNGYYAWEGVAGEVEYYYEIYQTDEFYEVDEDEVPVVSGTTKSTTILDELPFGYYKIYVYSRSTDYNQYLDCDFEDKGNILSDTFIVSSQITSPQIAFKEDGGVYKLDITISRYASKYTVYIDDVYATELNLTSESWSDEVEVIKTIPLDDKFIEAKDYNISVVASGGSLYDETLHIASQASSIIVTRVAEAECEVEIKYDDYGRISHEYLVATKSENTTSVKAYRGDSELNVIKQGENFLIDMLDSEFGGTFGISLVCKAKGAESGHYYLDSMAKSLSFERVETPQNLAYSNGTLSFECDSANVENYLACIEIIKDSDVTAYYTFEIESTLTSLDLQTKIEEIISSSAAFKTAYNDMDNLKISLYAIASSQSEEGTYFIPSLQSNVVTIGVLSQATLSFDQATQTLSWELEDEAQSYDLYVGGEVKVENITSSSITLSQITGLDLSVTNEFTVLSKHSEYFDSKLSNIIKIRQLRNASTAVIAKNGSDFQMTVNFTADNAISAVYVNGEKANFSAGSTMANIAISTSGAQSVQLIALEGLVDGVYCINSSVQTFTLQQLGAIKLTKSGDTISWNNPSLNVMSGNSGNPYSVQLVLTDGETSAFYTAGNDETSISIKDIEDIFKVDLNDDTQDFTISGKVVFGSSYSLNITSPSAVGLYGESVGQNTLTIYKLQSMGDVEVTFAEDDDASDNVSAQMNGVVKFTFEDLWSDLSNANFVLTIGSREIPISAKECNYLSLGSYALSLDGGKWTLSIPLSHFASQRISITFNVVCEGNVDSDGKDVLVTRLDTISEEDVTLSEEGILSIDDTQTGASYAITITHANGTKTGTFAQSEISKIDITTDAWLKNLGAGDYTIKIVAYDESGKLLPSLEVFEYSAHQYEGIIEAYIDDEGKIILSVASDSYTNAIFTLQTIIGEKTYSSVFTPKSLGTDGDSERYLYYITMQEVVTIFAEDFEKDNISIYRDYTFAFTVRGQGGINSAWKTVSFTYSGDYDEADLTPMFKRADYDEDYLIFAISENVTTTSIYTHYSASYTIDEGGEEKQMKGESEIIYSSLGTPLDQIKGYWIEGVNGGRFAKINNAIDGETSLECYAVKLNDILSNLAMGSYSIESYRTAVDENGNIIQFSPMTLSGYKLSPIHQSVEEEESEYIDLRISNGYLLEWDYVVQDKSTSAQSASSYYVVVTEGENVRKALTNVAVYDLRSCGLDKNKTYQVYVIAVNADNTVLASNKSQVLEVVQYETPLTPTVKDGALGFDLAQTEGQEGTLFGDMVAYFSGTSALSYEETLLNVTNYTLPASFDLQSFAESKIRIKFTAITSEGAEGKSYYLTLPVSDLLLDYEINGYSYFDLLTDYVNEVTDEKVKTFIQTILSSKRGLASDGYLFDDEGRTIPKGIYEVSFVQKATGNYIESPATTTMRIYVSAGATLELNQETVGGKANQYTVTVTPNKTATTEDGVTFTETTALNYRMLLRGDRVDVSYFIDFTYDLTSNTWSGEFLGIDINSTDAGMVLYTMDLENGEGIKYFKLNMSLLRDVIEILLAGEDKTFDIGTEYQVDVYALANGDIGVVNGKSGIFTLAYQDLDVGDIKLENGVIILPTTTNGNLIVRYAYATTAGTTQVETFSIKKGDNAIDLSCITNGGSELEFISFALQGNYTYSTMIVESKIYGISHPYKLSNPTLASTNNNLRITYSAVDLSSGATDSMNGFITYVVSNDFGGSHTSDTTTNQIDYQVGYYNDEKNASEFYVYLQGNSGNFVKLSQGDEYFEESENYDYQLALSSGDNLKLIKEEVDGETVYKLYQVVFKSEQSSITAKMLDYGQRAVEENYKIERGSISFNLPLSFTSEIKADDGSEAEIIYKIDLKYYDKQDDDSTSTYVTTQMIYLTNDYIVDGWLKLDGQNINRTNYDLVSFDVTALVAKTLSSQTTSSIATLDGKYYSINGSFTYADGSYALRSQILSTLMDEAEAKFAHPDTPTKPTSTGTLTLMNGQITFVTEELALTDGEFVDSQEMDILVLATNSEGQQIEITGKIKVSDESEGRVAVFIPDDFESEVLNALKGKSFTISVMTYGENKILSLPLNITEVYKLPDLNGNYEIKVKEHSNDEGVITGYTTYIDFANYFANFTVSARNEFYSIQVTARDAEGSVISSATLTNSAYTFDLSEDMASVAIEVIDNQSSAAMGRINLLHSDILQVLIEKTQYDAKIVDGEEQRIISWNEENSGFEWMGGESGATYEFFYKLIISGKTEMGITSNNFYLSQNMGDVTSFLIQARDKRMVDEEGNPTIYIFSESIEADATELGNKVDIFASGNGTATNPYLIKTVTNSTGEVVKKAIDQFNAISTRNSEGVYFKLGENLTLTIGENYIPLAAFHGNLLGNGYTLTINANTINSLSSTYTISGVMGNDYTFSHYSSLFERISPKASVSNLKIEYYIKNNSLNSNYVLYAPLSAFNYGTIERVTIEKMGVFALSGEGTNRTFISGVTGANFGSIISCQNNASFTYSAPQQFNNLFAYSAITSFNDAYSLLGSRYSGTLLNCSNNADVNITVATSGSVYASGITIKNGGAIYACYNSGLIKTSSTKTGVSSYASGIAISNVGGRLSYCYNDANITSIGMSSSQIAGIVIALNSGNVEGLVDVCSLPIAYTCVSVSASDCYVLNGTTVVSGLTGATSYLTGEINKTLGENIYLKANNYNIRMTIAGSDGSYSASVAVS